MSNPFGDVAAGTVDVLRSYLDLVGLAEGAVRGVGNVITGDDFSEGFDEAKLLQLSDAINEGTSELFNSDPESALRRNVADAGFFLSGLFSGGSGLVTKKALGKLAKSKNTEFLGKMAKRTNIDEKTLSDLYKKSAKRDLANVIGKEALITGAFTKGMDALSGTESSLVNNTLTAAGAMYGTKALYDKAVRNVKRTAGMTRRMEETDSFRKKRQELKRHEFNARAFDAKGGSIKMAETEGLLDGLDLTDLQRLNMSVSDIASNSPIVKKTHKLMERVNTMADNQQFHDFLQLEGELAQRIKAASAKLSEYALQTKNLESLNKLRTYVGLNKLDIKLERAIAKTLDDLLDIDRNSMIQLMKKNNSLNIPVGLINNKTGKLYELADLVHERNNLANFVTRNFRNEFNEFNQINREMLDMAYKSGIISSEEYDRIARSAKSWGYVSRSETLPTKEGGAVYRTAEFMKAGTTSGSGVLNPTNVFSQLYKNVKNLAEEIEYNDRARNILPTIQKNVNEVIAGYEQEMKRLDDIIKDPTISVHKQRAAVQAKRFLDQRIGVLSKFDIPDIDELKKSKVIDSWNKRLSSISGVKILSVKIDGQDVYYSVPPLYENIIEQAGRTITPLGEALRTSNSISSMFKTGWLNPAFAPVSYMYGLWEVLGSIMIESGRMGNKDSAMKIILEQGKQFKESFKRQYHSYLSEKLKLSKSHFFGYDQSDIDRFDAEIEEILNKKFMYNASPVNQLGEDLHNGMDALNFVPINATTMDKVLYNAKKYWKFVDDSAPVRLLKAITEAARESSQMTIIARAEELFPTYEQRRKFVEAVSEYTSDTRRRGAGGTSTTDIINALRDYMPYGSSIIEGLYGKMNYIDPVKNFNNLSNDLSDIFSKGASGETGAEVLMRLGAAFKGMADSDVFDVMTKMIVIPTAITYVWNHLNEQQARDYHAITDFEKSNRHVLTNFGGLGVHAYIPIDQEWSVLTNITESILDSIFGLSDIDTTDPAFSYRSEILTSLGRSLGIELPTIGEVGMNMMGYKTNPNVAAMFGDDNIINPIPVYAGNKRHKDGYFAPETAEILGTVAGTLGRSIVNMADDVPANSITRLPFVSLGMNTTSRNATASYVDEVYAKDRKNPIIAEDMRARRKLEAQLRRFLATGRDDEGNAFNADRQTVIDAFNDRISKLNAQMYYNLTSDTASL